MAGKRLEVISGTSPSTFRIALYNFGLAGILSASVIWWLGLGIGAAALTVVFLAVAAFFVHGRSLQTTLTFDGDQIYYRTKGGARLTLEVRDITEIRYIHEINAVSICVATRNHRIAGLDNQGHAPVLRALVNHLDETGRGEVVHERVRRSLRM